MIDSSNGFELRPWQRFHVRVTLLIGAVVFVILAATGYAFYEVSYRAQLGALQRRIRSTVMILSNRLNIPRLAGIGAPAWKEDEYYIRVREGLTKICLDDRDIGSIYILRKTDEPRVLAFVMDVGDEDKNLATFGEPYPIIDAVKLMERGLTEVTVEEEMTADEWGLSLSGYAPLQFPDGRTFGLVGVDILASNIDGIRERVLAMTMGIFGIAALALFFVSVFIGRRIRGPINGINAAAKKIATGDFEHEVVIQRRDEFGLMGHHFNTIAKSLKERDFLRDTFGRYVSPDIAKRVLADRSAAALGGEEREVTVVFSDIEGYSSMTELIPPKEVLGMLNTYLAAMNEIIKSLGEILAARKSISTRAASSSSWATRSSPCSTRPTTCSTMPRSGCAARSRCVSAWTR